MRKVIAKPIAGWLMGGPQELEVRSYPWGFLRVGNWTPNSLKVSYVPGPGVLWYRTVTDFFSDWVVAECDTWQVRCPFVKEPIGFGRVFEMFAELFPLWVKAKFAGCLDRKMWLDMWAEFRPWNEQKF